ncbi:MULTISPECIES: STAS domain-containing protein [unclassified Streptomyces]|uniref:STAS domain-containing protein n=1 Tax=unclassified Streptomyces TaxID=2593676 RepID=UPI0021ADC750|nr:MULTISPECIES: STAS domain-containing protein [unclassified Streptomyces]
MLRPAQYHLLYLPDGSWETVSCLASVIRCRATAPTVLLDVSPVERLTFNSLTVLARKAMHLRSVCGQLLLTGPGPTLRKMVDRTGTGSLLPLFTDNTAALRALAEDGRTWCRVDLSAVPDTLFTEPPLQ